MNREPKFNVINWDEEGPFDAESHYDFQKKRQVEALRRRSVREGQELHQSIIDKYMGATKTYYEASIKDMASIDKLNQPLAIIVPTHSGHLPWLTPCLESIKDLGYYILVSFDNSYARHGGLDRMWPQPQVSAMADAFVTKHFTWRPSVGSGHFWNMMYGLTMLKGFGFTYAFSINGDCILEKPENFPQLLEMLGENDLFPNHTDVEKRFMGTMGWIGKVDVMLKFFQECIETQYVGSRTTEGRLAFFIADNNISITTNDVNPEKWRYKIPEPECTWYRTVGFRHLHAEHKIRKRHKMEPLERHHYDLGPGGLYMGKFFASSVVKYWETGEEKYLKIWNDK